MGFLGDLGRWLGGLLGAVLHPAPPRPPTPAPAPPPSPPPAPDLSFARATLDAHNELRQRASRLPLTLNEALCVAAAGHAAWCDRNGFLTHGGDGTPQSRARAAGYEHGVGENGAIAPTLDLAMAEWRDPAHLENILSDQFIEMGVGRTDDYVIVMFGTSWVAAAPPRPSSDLAAHRGARAYSCRPAPPPTPSPTRARP